MSGQANRDEGPANRRREASEFRAEGRPIVLSRQPTDSEIRAAVAQWIELMARDDYASAVAAVFRRPPTPDSFRETVECFCIEYSGRRPEEHPSERARVVPASPEHLKRIEVARDGIPPEAVAWVGFFVPLNNGFDIWITMGVFPAGDRCVLEFEIFHL